MSRPPAERITNVEAPATLVAGERARQLAAPVSYTHLTLPTKA